MVRDIWLRSPGQGETKIVGMKDIEGHLQEYKISVISKELKRIEEIMKDDTLWNPSEETIKRTKPWILSVILFYRWRKSYGGKKVKPYGCNMVTRIQSSFTRKLNRGRKPIAYIS